jgi:hypothetical protein
VLHFKVLLLDAHVVPLVQTIKHFLSLNGILGHLVVDLRDVSWEHQFHILKFVEENFHSSDILFALQLRLIKSKFCSSGVREEKSKLTRHKRVECVPRFYKADFTFKAQVRHIVDEDNFFNSSRETSGGV